MVNNMLDIHTQVMEKNSSYMQMLEEKEILYTKRLSKTNQNSSKHWKIFLYIYVMLIFLYP